MTIATQATARVPVRFTSPRVDVRALAQLGLVMACLALAACAPASPARATLSVHAALPPEALSDENPCAHAVLAQLEALFASGARRHRDSWQLVWDRAYAPAGLTPGATLIDERVAFNARHVQGFTRSYSPDLPYVVSHDGERRGSVLVVGRTSAGLSLHNLRALETGHPSGVHILGRYAAVVDDDDLVLLDLAASAGLRETRHRMPAPRLHRAGGGVGLAKLTDGSHLLMVSTPGSLAPGPRASHFSRLEGDLSTSPWHSYAGYTPYEQPSEWRDDYRYSENITLITECGSRQLYALHTTGARSVRKLQ